jgi:phospholipase/carboxylesterase
MTTGVVPTVVWSGGRDSGGPMVVLLRGRGSDEQEILALAPLLPAANAYAAVPAPLTEGPGFAWFAETAASAVRSTHRSRNRSTGSAPGSTK